MIHSANCQSLQEHVALAALAKACARQKDVHKGSQLHAKIVMEGLLENNNFIGSALMDFYSKCGLLAKVQKVFDELFVKDAFSWTALISAYIQHGHSEKALTYFEKMNLDGCLPDAVTFSCALKACGSIQALKEGEKIHAEIARKQLLEKDIILGNALVDMYAKCGVLSKAQQVFDDLLIQDIVTWNALITGYVHFGQGDEAIKCLEQMQNRGLTPNAVTLLCCLQACGNTRALCRGKQMHVDIINKGMLREHCLLGNALVDMYAKCGAFEKAERVSNEQLIRNRVTWTALIAGYCEHGEHDKAILCHQRMQSEGLSSDGLTLAWVLKACSSIRDLERGKEVHVTIAREGFLKRDNVLANALVDMYAKCGAPEMAEQVFEELPMCDGVVSWTAVITGYHQQGQGEEALSCFKRMQMKGFSPDIVTLLCTLQVCGSLGAIQNGEQIHASVVRQGLLGNDKLGNVLVDMYSKCGKVFKAQLVFDDLGIQDVVSWTALMAGHALTGKHDEVFGLLNRMMRLGISPNSVTLTVVLSACTDVCLLNKAPTLFEMMNLRYGVSPAVEHCTCIVDLLGRAGRFDEAVNIAEGMTSVKNLPVWLALLATCRQWDNVEIGEFAFEHILHSN